MICLIAVVSSVHVLVNGRIDFLLAINAHSEITGKNNRLVD